jgi:hypothetical protein
MPPRAISRRYDDPLDLVWLDAAAKLGMRVERSEAAYASWDGRATLSVARREDLDPDDSLAQLVFHEICHALVAGPAGQSQLDWGLDNQSERDLIFEHACHRVQAGLAARHGLRDFFAVTTEWRPYWDALPDDPLAASDDPALPLARAAIARADSAPYAAVLAEALSCTARIAELVRGLAPADSLFKTTRARHPSGFFQSGDPESRCGACAWSHKAGPRALGCRQASREGRDGVRVFADTPACDRFESRLSAESCAGCGACCREGFDRVDVRPRDAVRKHHPSLVHEDAWGSHLPRPGGRCVALEIDTEHGHRCRIYSHRPKACRDFAVGGDACLEARRRVGLSR